MLRIFPQKVLPVSALVDTGTLALAGRAMGRANFAILAVDVLVVSLIAAGPAEEALTADAYRAALNEIGPTGALRDASLAVYLMLRFADMICNWSRVPHEPQGGGGPPPDEDLPWFSPDRGRALGALLVEGDENWFVSMLSGAVVGGAKYAFTEDLRALAPGEVNCEPFFAGRVLHYLDAHAGPAVAARLAALVPEDVLRDVRSAATAGRWGQPRPRDAPGPGA